MRSGGLGQTSIFRLLLLCELEPGQKLGGGGLMISTSRRTATTNLGQRSHRSTYERFAAREICQSDTSDAKGKKKQFGCGEALACLVFGKYISRTFSH